MSVHWSIGLLVHNAFLDASTHLYMRVCPSVGPSVRGSIHPAFFLIAEIDKKQHRIMD